MDGHPECRQLEMQASSQAPYPAPKAVTLRRWALIESNGSGFERISRMFALRQPDQPIRYRRLSGDSATQPT